MVRKRQIGLLAFGLLVAAGVYLGSGQVALIQIGTAYTAKQTCSCLRVSGRPLGSCMTDLDPTAARLFSIKVNDRSVTVSGFFLFSSTAVFDEGFGCHVAR